MNALMRLTLKVTMLALDALDTFYLVTAPGSIVLGLRRQVSGAVGVGVCVVLLGSLGLYNVVQRRMLLVVLLPVILPSIF